MLDHTFPNESEVRSRPNPTPTTKISTDSVAEEGGGTHAAAGEGGGDGERDAGLLRDLQWRELFRLSEWGQRGRH